MFGAIPVERALAREERLRGMPDTPQCLIRGQASLQRKNTPL